MSLMTLNFILFLLLPTILVAVGLVFLYVRIFRPLYQLDRHLFPSAREQMMPDASRASDSIIKLSSVAILLTFTVIRILGDKVSCVANLLLSWICFGCCIFLGIIIMNIRYIVIAHKEVLTTEWAKFQESKTKEDGATCLDIRKKAGRLQKTSFICLSLQPVIFLIAIYCLYLFIVQNILSF